MSMPTFFDEYKFIDIHYHADPDLYKRRRNAIETGRVYNRLDGAVVLKSHLGATTVQATLAQQDGLPVFPSLVLNQIAGGIDYRVIIRSLAEYHPTFPSKLLVHFPTITGRKHQSSLQRQLVNPTLSEHTQRHETLFGDNLRLKKEVIDILKMSTDYPIVLSTGHASKAEVYALIDACDTHQVPHLLLNQPASPMTGLAATELKQLTQLDCVWVEQTILTYLLGYQSKEDFRQVLTDVPRVIYSSDLGQTTQMDIETWLLTSANYYKEFNISTQRENELCRINAATLLKL